MKNVKVGVRLVCGFLVVALLSLVIGIVSIYSTDKLEGNLKNIGEIALPYTVNLGIVKAELCNIKTVQRTMLISDLADDVKSRQERVLGESRTAYRKAFQDLEKLQLDKTSVEKLGQLKKLMDVWRESNDAFFNAAKENNHEKMKTIALESGRVHQEKALAFMDEILNDQIKLSSRLVVEAESGAKTSLTIMISAIVAGFILSIGLGLLLTRSITQPLTACVAFAGKVSQGKLDEQLAIRSKDETGVLAVSLNQMVANLREKIDEANVKSAQAEAESEKAKIATQEAEEARRQAERAKAEGMLQAAMKLEGVVEIVTSASEQLSAQVEQSSRGAEEQAHRVGETATSMEEMNATVLEVAQNASNAAEAADQAREKAEEGAKVVGLVVKGIADVQQQSQAMKTDMSTLGKQAEGIGQIMNVISDIADQTNLLALNAAIEAARAGEAGRGFAVVADEVRKLAEKTMTATKEVGEAIRGIQDGTKKNIENVERSGKTIEEATELAHKSGASLREIVALVESTTDQVRSIATASEEQSSASEEINHSIEDVNRISSETSDAMRQSAQAVGELANQAQILKTLIEEMKSEGGGVQTALASGRKMLS
ncbi:MAG: methyl-accepting chemotaxis protein [Solidesulfovibrio sp.]